MDDYVTTNSTVTKSQSHLAELGTCNYGDLIDTLFTDVEGVAQSAAFYSWFSLKRFVVAVLPPTCMVLELSDWLRKNLTLNDRA